MGIIKRNNKLINSLAGEVYKESDAIIDLRSDYGVTKDVSNNVSQVKLYNNPSKLFRDNSSNCIENGDGFDFSANISGYLKGGFSSDFDSFFIGFWAKLNTLTPSGERIVYSHDESPLRGWRVYFLGTHLLIYTGFSTVILQTNGYVGNSDQWEYFTIERNSSGGYVGTTGGIVRTKANNTQTFLAHNYSGIVGNALVNLTKKFDGSLDDLILKENSPYNSFDFALGEQVFTPPKRSSE